MKYPTFLIILALAIISSCKNHEHEHHEELKFAVTSPLMIDTLVYDSYVSQIHSIQHIELRALEGGYLQNIYVDEGQTVKKGQPLFQIMPIINEAEVLRAQAEVSFAEIEYQNTKSLADSNIVSKNELALTKATLDKAKAELALAQAHLSFTKINAPFDGIVGRFDDVRLGSLVEEGELLTTLSDNSKMWVYFNVPEAEYLDYSSRAKSDILSHVKLVLANGKLFSEEGVVETIEADFNNETGNIAFRATFQNPDKLLRHGETGTIQIIQPIENALLIPQKATFEILDKKFVFVVDENNVANAREITIMEELHHIFIVSDGLKSGEKIILEGIGKVKTNDKISYNFIEPQSVFSSLELYAE